MNASINALAKKFFALKAKHEAAADALKAIGAEWEEAEQALLAAMVDEGTNSISIAGMGMFVMTTKNYLSVNAASKPQFFQYLKKAGHGALLKEDVNPRTLTAFLKGHLEEVTQKYVAAGKDAVEARNEALKYLNSQGASYFSDRGVSFRKASE